MNRRLRASAILGATARAAAAALAQPADAVDDAELARRRERWSAPAGRHRAGLLSKYAITVGQADKGAVTHPGGAEWPVQTIPGGAKETT